MKITYTGNLEIIKDAIQDALFILRNEDFHILLQAKENFDNSNATGKDISRLIMECTIEATIELYKPVPIPPWSRANAYTEPKEPTKIFLNKRKLNRSIESIAATIVHEFIHLIDFSSDEFDFGHGDNDSSGKGETAPYWIDICAYEILTGNTGKVIFQHK